MTVLNFPSTTGQPTDGSFTYTENGVIYTWNGSYWAANNADNLDSRYVNVGGDTMTGDLTVPNLISEGDVQTTSLNGGPLAGFRNQIINGNFEIAQRGTGSFTNEKEYTLDRWRARDNASGAVNVSQMSVDIPGHPFALRYTATTGAISGGVDTFIELPSGYTNGPFAPSSTWTLSYWSNTPVSNAIQAQDSSAAEGTANRAIGGAVETLDTYNTFTKYSQTFTMPAAPFENTKSCLKVVFTTGTLPADFILTGVQLEPGPVATPFEHRPIGTELALCQRYFISTNGSGYFSFPPAPSTGGRYIVYMPATMRTNPTIYLENKTSINTVIGKTTHFFFDTFSNATPNFDWYSADAEL